MSIVNRLKLQFTIDMKWGEPPGLQCYSWFKNAIFPFLF